MIFAVVSLSGCFDELNGGPANIVISFGGERDVVDGVNYDPNDTATHKSLNYKIELTGSVKNYDYSFSGTTFNATVMPGDYNISIVSYKGDIVYGAGSKDITVKPGQNKVSLTMYKAYMITFYDNETGVQIKQIVRKENGYKATPPDGQDWYDEITLQTPFNFNKPVENNLILYSSVPVFNDETIIYFGDWLASKKTNSPSTAYKVKMNVSSFTIESATSPITVGDVIARASSRYVSLDLSGSTLTSIVDIAFQNCSNLVNITIGNSVTSIERSAFDGCTNLTSVTLGNKVGSIGTGAFSGCTKLETIVIGNGVTEIGENAFYSCNKLKNVTIGNSVEHIRDSAFSACSSLKSITIPARVKSIGTSAFDGCTQLTEVIFETGSNIQNTDFGDYVFPEGANGGGGNTLKNLYNSSNPKHGTYKYSPSPTGGSQWTKVN